MEKKLTLGYWPIRGLAQPIRLFLKYLEIPFVDKRYTDRDEWFTKDKPAFNSPLSNLPYLSEGNEAVFESDAIYHYIALKLNKEDMLGTDLKQKVMVAEVRGVITDIKMRLGLIWYSKEGHEQFKQQFMPMISSKFEALDKLIGDNQYLTGNTITYVDFIVYEYIDAVLQFQPEIFQNLKRLTAFHQRINEIPQIKAYLASEEFIAKPFNNPNYAVWYG